jgi:hypothetical protein
MPYKTRQTIFGIPLTRNPFSRLEIRIAPEDTTRELRRFITPFFFEAVSLQDGSWNLEGASIGKARGLVGHFLNHGDVNILLRGGGHVELKNIPYRSEFNKAVKGDHAALQADIPVKPLKLTEGDLEDFAYPIPNVMAVGHLFMNLTSNVSYMKSVAPGKILRQGEKPFLSGSGLTMDVIAPCDGVFLGDFNYFIDNDLQKEKDLVNVAKELNMGDVQIIGFFRPVKGQPTPQWIDFYDARNIQYWMSKIGNDKNRLPVELKGDQEFLEKLTEAYRAMKMDFAPAIDMEKIKTLKALRQPNQGNGYDPSGLNADM